MLIGAVYRSPNSDTINFSHLCDLMNVAFNSPALHVLVTGDFNMPLIDWTYWTVASQGSIDAEFLDLVNDLFVSQHIDFPTRIREGQVPSLLDLVLTNEESFISEIMSLPPLGKSDHIIISFEFQCYLKINGCRNYKYNYGRGDYQSMTSELLNINWPILFNGLDIDATWSIFHSTMLQLINKYVPTILISSPGPRPMWMNSATLKAVKQKRKAWMKYKATRQISDFVTYTKYRNLSTIAVRDAKYTFERNLASKVKSDCNLFWKYVRSCTKVQSNVGIMERDDGSPTETDYEAANVLNTFFTSVFTKESLFDIPSLSDKSNGMDLNSITITHQDIIHQIQKLDPNKSCGPDKIHPRVIKGTIDGLITLLFYIYTKSLHEGSVPASWKDAIITPIHKKGNKKVPSNYRPISLTSVFCRMLESIIKGKIMTYFDINNLFFEQQHGFRPMMSCVTQLLHVMEHWTRFLDDGNDVDIIYLDFRKAFDCVPHQRLLSKLKAYGMAGSVLNWVTDFLSNR